MSEKKENTFFEDFQKIQKELKTVGKNTDGYNYRYADLDQVWDKVRDIIQKNNFIVYSFVRDGIVTTNATHKDGELIQSELLITQTDPQKKGAEITYYRRYNLLAIFNIIVAGEDTDAKDTGQTTDEFKKQVSEMVDVDGLRQLHEEYKKAGDNERCEIINARGKELTKIEMSNIGE